MTLRENSGASADKPETRAEAYRSWIEVIAKVIGALAIVFVAFVGNEYQSKMSSVALINQREQAETSLRASMLGDLIEPFIGKDAQAPSAAPDGDDTRLDREVLLAELITLNFHDHFEFKPVLESIDRKLRDHQREEGRFAIASVARRVIDRQINMLSAVGPAAEKGFGATKDQFFFETKAAPATPTQCFKASGADRYSLVELWTGTPLCSASPDRNICLQISLSSSEDPRKIYERQQIVASVDAYSNPGMGCDALGDKKPILQLPNITISTFDFPLSDNTKVDSDHRFAISILDMYREISERPADLPRMTLAVIWFPQGFVTERERPITYSELRKEL